MSGRKTGNEASRNEAPRQGHWKAYGGHFALPTVLLFCLVVAGEVLVWCLHLGNLAPLWLCSGAAIILAYLSFTVAHEAAHGNIHGTGNRWRWLGELSGWISGLILLAPYPAFRVVHLQHHSRTNDPELDPDHWVVGANAFSVALRCATILPFYYFWFLFSPLSQTRAMRQLRPIIFGTVGLLVFVFLLLVHMGLGRELLWLWVVPTLLATGILGFLFNWVPHHPHTSQERYRDTRILLIPGLTLPMLWQNYHLIHHLFPRIPFYLYPACFRGMREELRAKRSPIEGFAAKEPLPRPFTTGG